MTMQELLLEAVEQRVLRRLDVQFAMMVAGNDEPSVMLATAILSRDTGEGHVCLPLSRLQAEAKTAALQACFALHDETLDWSATLMRSRAVSAGDEPTPLVLVGDRSTSTGCGATSGPWPVSLAKPISLCPMTVPTFSVP